MNINNNIETGFLYILNYSNCTLDCIHLSSVYPNADPDELTNEDFESLLTELNYNLDEISYMYSTYEKSITNVY